MKRILILTLCILIVTGATSNVFAAPFFTQSSKQAVFLSPLERWMPTWNRQEYVSLLERAGYQVDVLMNENVTISFLKVGLAKYDLIILRTDSFQGEGFNYYCSGEPVTPQTRATYSAEISADEVSVGVCVGFSMVFLKHSYPPGSLRGLVYAISAGTAELAPAFIKAGASAFMGYYEEMGGLGWGRMDALATTVLRYLSQGSSVKGAVIELYTYLAIGHGGTSTMPAIYWYGNGDYTI